MNIHPLVYQKFLDIFLTDSTKDIWIVNYNIKFPTKIWVLNHGKVEISNIDLVLVENPKKNVVMFETEVSGFKDNPVMQYVMRCGLRTLTTEPNLSDFQLNHFISAVRQYDIANIKNRYFNL